MFGLSESISNVPYLIIGFNRPEKLREAIKNVSQFSDNIFISIDGARNSKEQEKVSASISTAKEFVDVSKIKLNEKNLGCKRAVEGGLDWFFDQNMFGAIIEDDIRIGKAFAETINTLATNPRREDIGSFCGYNHFPQTDRHDFYNSHFTGVWGWATWSDIWNRGIKDTATLRDQISKADKSIFLFKNEKSFWVKKLDEIDAGKKDSWAYPWSISLILNNLYTIRPFQTYTENAGFDSEATHTTSRNKRVEQNKIKSSEHDFKLDQIEFDLAMDKVFYERQLNSKIQYKILRRLGFRV